MSASTARSDARGASTSTTAAVNARCRRRRLRPRRVVRGRTASASASASSSSSADDVAALEERLVRSAEAGDDAATLRTIDDLTKNFKAWESVGDNEALASAVDGTWRLIYSTKSAFDATAPLGRRTDNTAPGIEAVFAALFGSPSGSDASSSASRRRAAASSSPIQRAVLSKLSEGGFAVRQGVRLVGESSARRVDQAVCFGDGIGYFRLSANASLEPETSKEELRGRINYGFDLAYLELEKPVKVRLPYPVPFRLLGAEAMGFLTTDYVSDAVRISTGNKGTTFVFVKEDRDALPYASELYD
jgi:hypothetical protein